MTLRPLMQYFNNTVELHWPEHLLNYEKVFETGVVRANEFFFSVCLLYSHNPLLQISQEARVFFVWLFLV